MNKSLYLLILVIPEPDKTASAASGALTGRLIRHYCCFETGTSLKDVVQK